MANPLANAKLSTVSQRDFLKLAELSAAALPFRPFAKLALSEFPQADQLGRITRRGCGINFLLPPRFYCSQIVWVDQFLIDEAGQVWYRLNEKYGSGDIFWRQAKVFRPLTAGEVSPISADAQNMGPNVVML